MPYLVGRKLYSAFADLDADQIARVNAVVAAAQAADDQAHANAPGFFSTLWGNAIGASSAVNAANTDVAGSDTLLATDQARAAQLIADPNATEADVQAFEQGTSATGNQALIATTTQLSASAVEAQVVAPTISTVKNAVSNPFGIPIWAWAAGAIAVLVLLNMLKKKG